MNIFGISDIGSMRKLNQDNYYTKMITDKIALGVVCDGMGGANGGCEASAIAIFEFSSFMKETLIQMTNSEGKLENMNDARMRRLMNQALNRANEAVYTKSKQDEELSGMGTTLVCSVTTPDRIYVMNVGDSRMYSIYENKMTRITKDHSFVQYLLDNGMIEPKEAETHPNRNIITRAIGTHENVEGDFFVIEKDCDSVLLCSDGLTNYVEEKEICRIVSSPDMNNENKVKLLVDTANKNGGGDNITVILTSFQ